MLDVKEREESKDNVTFFGLSQNIDEGMFYLVGEY